MATLQKLRVLDALQFRKYQFYLSSALVFYAARWMQQVVLGWLVLERTNSALMVGMAAAFQWLPMLLLGAFTGVLADRLNRRIVLIVSQLCSAAAFLLLGFLIVTGRVETWHIMVISLFVGLAWAVDWPCRRSLIPDIVGGGNTLNAISLDHSAGDIMAIVGSISGGQFISSIGIGNTYYLVGVMYLLAVFFIFLIGPLKTVTLVNNVNIRANLVEGIKYIFKSRPILAVLVITVFMNAFIFPFRQMLPIFARDILMVGPSGLGFLSAAPGIGSLIGSLVLAYLGHVHRAVAAFFAGSFMMGFALIFFAGSTMYPLSLGILVICGIGMATFGNLQSSILLDVTAQEMRGRVMGILSLAIGAMPLGIFVFGAATDLIGARWVVGVSSALAAALTIVVFYFMPGVRKIK